jgi:hypothetical protein
METMVEGCDDEQMELKNTINDRRWSDAVERGDDKADARVKRFAKSAAMQEGRTEKKARA